MKLCKNTFLHTEKPSDFVITFASFFPNVSFFFFSSEDLNQTDFSGLIP